MSGKRDPERSIRRLSLAGGLAALLLVGGAGGLSAAIEFAGAVIAAGVVVVKTDVMSIQHARGGIIAGIDISEGERVGTGQRLIRLDGTQLAASLAIINFTLDEMLVRQARLGAERDAEVRFELPAALAERVADDHAFAALVAAEQQLFSLRGAAIAGQKQQLREQIKQLEAAISGLGRQQAGRVAEQQIVASQLLAFRDLTHQGLMQTSQLNAMERDSASLAAEIGRIEAAIAEHRGRISEVMVEILAHRPDPAQGRGRRTERTGHPHRRVPGTARGGTRRDPSP
ncbi:MAG: hypothetical protein IPK28_15690 [Devosia sp.]|nr:hypothetical protein [Devosia sp.]